MVSDNEPFEEITSDMLLDAYACGIFPMADTAHAPDIYWVEPKFRGIIPLDQFHIPSKLQKLINRDIFKINYNQNFDAVINACATPAPNREKTWINPTIRKLYKELFEKGHCHTVEVYFENDLVGGLYGVSLGSAFFGESMFHTKTDASKVALYFLVQRLKENGFTLLDIQFITDHLKQFGAIEIPKIDYQILLARALTQKPKSFT